MGSGGTEWETADTFDPTRLNQKTRFVGTGEQATAFITSPQVGQQVYATASDATFTIDKLSTYNSSSSWISPDIDAVDGDSGADNAGLSGNQANIKSYLFFTLPSTEKFYVITQIDWVEDSSSGNVIGGVDIVNANPPTTNTSALVALMPVTASAGSAGTQHTTAVSMSKVVRGGTVLGAWLHSGTASTFRRATSTTGTYSRSLTYTATPRMGETTAWDTPDGNTKQLRAKVHYRGYD